MKKKDIRKKEKRFRKNLFWLILLAIILWFLIIGIVYLIEPSTIFIVPAFFIIVFIALLLTFSLLFSNTRRGVLSSFGVLFFLILRYLGVGNILNLLLISAIVVAMDLYFSRE
jgi:TRAP-type C4-dicarboxylate transport system permease large subunit